MGDPYTSQGNYYRPDRKRAQRWPASRVDLLFLSDFLNCAGHEREQCLRDVNEIMASSGTGIPTM